jgi:hypothetical protein
MKDVRGLDKCTTHLVPINLLMKEEYRTVRYGTSNRMDTDRALHTFFGENLGYRFAEVNLTFAHFPTAKTAR